jgi:hypothetical protein
MNENRSSPDGSRHVRDADAVMPFPNCNVYKGFANCSHRTTRPQKPLTVAVHSAIVSRIVPTRRSAAFARDGFPFKVEEDVSWMGCHLRRRSHAQRSREYPAVVLRRLDPSMQPGHDKGKAMFTDCSCDRPLRSGRQLPGTEVALRERTSGSGFDISFEANRRRLVGTSRVKSRTRCCWRMRCRLMTNRRWTVTAWTPVKRSRTNGSAPRCGRDACPKRSGISSRCRASPRTASILWRSRSHAS